MAVKKKITTKKPAARSAIKKTSSKKITPFIVADSNGDVYEMMRQQVISLLWKHEEITVKKMLIELKTMMFPKLGADLFDVFYSVRMELEKKGVIEFVPDKKPEHLRLTIKNKED